MSNKSNTQTAIMRYILAHFQAHNHAPTYLQIARAVGYKDKSGIYYHLNDLEAMGLITRKPGSPHSIRLTKEGKDHAAN